MTRDEFILKLCINLACLLLIALYIFIRSLLNKNYLYSIINKEKRLVLDNKLSIKQLQSTSWSKNLDEVTSFSSTSIAIILIVVAYLIEADLPYYKELYFKIILFIVSISAICYTLSIQLYNNAVSAMPFIKWTLNQRKIGASFQVIGWYGLILSVLFCIMLVDTLMGAILDLFTLFCVMIIYEIKLTER